MLQQCLEHRGSPWSQFHVQAVDLLRRLLLFPQLCLCKNCLAVFRKRCRLDDVKLCCWKPWSAVCSKTRASHGYPYKGNGYPSIGWMGCMCIQGCDSTSLGCNQWLFEFLLLSYGFQPVCPVPTITTFNITSAFLLESLPHFNALKKCIRLVPCDWLIRSLC